MIATDPHAPSMNAASDKDPFNNNCYGTLVDREYKPVNLKCIKRGRDETKEIPQDVIFAQ